MQPKSYNFLTEHDQTVFSEEMADRYAKKILTQLAQNPEIELIEIKAFSINIFKAHLRAQTTWVDPYTDLTHQIERDWWINDIHPTTEDFKTVSESQLPKEVWESRIHPDWRKKLDRLSPVNINDRNKLVREHPSKVVKTKVEVALNKPILDSISKKDFRAVFEPLVYEAQYC